MSIRTLWISLFIFMGTHGMGFSQDTHHWNNQFGTRAALLGGAVLTDTIDNAGVYYNPANLAFLDTSSVSINANLYGLENIEIENALGQRENFAGLQFNTVPLLVSGNIKINSPWSLSYGLITPVSFNFNGVARIETERDLIPDNESPGLENLVAESGLNTRVQETSVILGAGRLLGPAVGIGFSLVNTLRSVDFNYRFSAKTLTNTTDYFLVSRSQNEFVKYYTVRTALKAGINYQQKGYGLAATIQTPGLTWLGNGSVAEDVTLVNLPIREGGDRITAFGSARQEKIKAEFKTPVQFSIGGHKQVGKSILSLNITHFGGVNVYRIMEAEPGPFIRPEFDGSENFGPEELLNVETAMRPVTNFALGYEGALGSGLKILGSFRTDFSYFDTAPTLGNQIVTELTQWDIFHISAGTVLEKNRSSLTLGLVYSFGGTQEYFQENSFSGSNPAPPLEGALTITEGSYSNFGLLIGYSFRFKKFN
ncbi:hypothetical protein [Algoriphagus namhaensis]